MTRIDAVRCMECGFEDTDPESIPEKCPECGATLNNYYKEKIFASNSSVKGDRSG